MACRWFMKNIVILLAIFVPAFCRANISDAVLQRKIDETFLDMCKLQINDDYIDDIHWNYLHGRYDAFNELLFEKRSDFNSY